MEKAINLYKWIVSQNNSNKLFAIMFLIIISEGIIIIKNAENYRRDVFYYRNRFDNNVMDCEKKINECHNENRKEYKELLEKYKELYNETLKMR